MVTEEKVEEREYKCFWLIEAVLIQRLNLPFHQAVRVKKNYLICLVTKSETCRKRNSQSLFDQSREHIQRRKGLLENSSL